MGAPLFHHFTENLSVIHDYLRDCFKCEDVEVLSVGADLRVGNTFVEVKACQEYIKDKCSNGKRRRGRFHFQHPVIAEYVLFVLMCENGEYRKKLLNTKYVENSILNGNLRSVIPYVEIFA